MGFAKLDDEFAGSSLLVQGGLELAGFWAVLLSMKGREGRIYESVPMLARRCGTSVKRIWHLLNILRSPDEHSRTPDHEGRRIVIETEPRFCVVILNHAKYIERDSTAAERARRYRERHGASRVTTVSHAVQSTSTSVRSTEGVQGEPPPAERPDDRGERLIREGRVAREREFYRLVAEIADAEDMDGSEVARKMTAYERDGQSVRGQVRPETLSDGRLDKSLEDGRAWLAAARAQKGTKVVHG